MKHKLLTSAGVFLALCSFGIQLNAQEKKDAKVLYFNDEMCFGGDFHSVSPNGKYAVGFSTDFSESAYMWNRESGTVTMITGSYDDKAQAYGVADDGTVAGDFMDENSKDKNGKPTMVPGYWKNGVWTVLPRLDGFPPIGGGMNGSATSISADGKTIGGYILREPAQYAQVIWVDGVLQPVTEEVLQGQGHMAACFAQGGKVMGGWAEHEDGARSPAVWVDGIMTRVDGLISPTESGEDVAFYEGITQCISENGTYASGYFDPEGSGSGCKPFVWTKEEGTEYIAEGGLASVVTNEKVVYGSNGYMGSAFIFKDGVKTDLDEYITKNYNLVCEGDYLQMSMPLGVSKDGKTIVGWAVEVVEMGAVMKPMIILLDNATGIGTHRVSEGVSIRSSLITSNLHIDGLYQSVQIYNTVGACVLVDNQQSGTVDFDCLENGIYYVKVIGGAQTQTFKVVLNK